MAGAANCYGLKLAATPTTPQERARSAHGLSDRALPASFPLLRERHLGEAAHVLPAALSPVLATTGTSRARTYSQTPAARLGGAVLAKM
ncbi:hypothetical protein IY145_02045 [Methylosinus sp. H3A]|uniref:hypothetical protein n=1 Tax=Methylosinus sp. H3A TaxID=2785786 RepID=UPI0018C2141D|nr:hypothetical protein [Methylosinus sp. H3A]MBG0808190.1 hypothetical protein [Methylosinus sp. H3A]